MEGEAAAAPAPAQDPQLDVRRRQTAAALGLLQRLPPQDLDANLTNFAKVAPHLEQTLEPYVTRPLQIKRDPEQNRFFVACEYNSDGKAHRSPWSNKYFPPPPGGDGELNRPSERLRQLEVTFNEVFDAYKTSYYEGGVSSVYLWDLDEGFAGAFLIRKECSNIPTMNKGVWDSVHIVEVRESASHANLAEYKLLASVRLHAEMTDSMKSETELGSLITRQAESRCNRGKKAVGDDMHLLQIGRMIEETEISIRQSLDSLYVAKQREVLHAVRSIDGPDPSDGTARPPAATAAAAAPNAAVPAPPQRPQ